MLRKFDIILWNNYVESLVSSVYFNEFQDFQIVFVNIVCKCKRANVDYINIWILHREYTSDLRILLLLQLFSCQSLQLRERIRVNVNFYSFLCFNLPPFVFELFLHFSPHLN
jgi:hypothetical protein